MGAEVDEMSEHAEIFLQPECCADPEFGRVWCDADALITEIDRYFTSGNGVQVERATIPGELWHKLRAELAAAREQIDRLVEVMKIARAEIEATGLAEGAFFAGDAKLRFFCGDLIELAITYQQPRITIKTSGETVNLYTAEDVVGSRSEALAWCIELLDNTDGSESVQDLMASIKAKLEELKP